ncbi:MAG: hypothetical protein J2P15_08995 [Micromonosporaceae bacterium]|nr:hypothetical protein [Micromonosporaceae bacterium]
MADPTLEQIAARIKAGWQEFLRNVDEFADLAIRVASKFSEDVSAAIAAFRDKVREWTATVEDLLLGFRAPARMTHDAEIWQQIDNALQSVAGALQPENLNPARQQGVPQWTGQAANRYNSQIAPQRNAASQFERLAGDTSKSLQQGSRAAYSFYAALLSLILACVRAVANGIATLSGAGGNVTSLVTNIIADIADKFIAVLVQRDNAEGAMRTLATTLRGHMSNFPAGWPDPTANASWPKVIDGRVQLGTP